MMSRIGGALDLVRMIEAHAVQDARAAVVAGRHEAIEAERRHHLDLVLRHGAERIARVIVAARRLLRVAVAAQVGADDGEVLRQPRRELVPGRVRERIAVHQQQRRPAAAMHRDDARAGGLDVGAREAFEHAAPVHLGKLASSGHTRKRRSQAIGDSVKRSLAKARGSADGRPLTVRMSDGRDTADAPAA